jgi:hypothetical protein
VDRRTIVARVARVTRWASRLVIEASLIVAMLLGLTRPLHACARSSDAPSCCCPSGDPLRPPANDGLSPRCPCPHVDPIEDAPPPSVAAEARSDAPASSPTPRAQLPSIVLPVTCARCPLGAVARAGPSLAVLKQSFLI